MAAGKGPLLGVHCSIAGGLHNAITIGEKLGCEAIQIFTKNQVQWREPQLTEQQAQRFLLAWQESNIRAVIAHTSYLINIASVDEQKRQRSIKSLIAELERCERLGIKDVVLHPGSYVGTTLDMGLQYAAQSLTIVLKEAASHSRILLETTAGQGSTLGRSTREIQRIIEQVAAAQIDVSQRLGMCIDTAHIYEAGYNITTYEGYTAYISEVSELIGLEFVKAIHANNSRTPLGSRKDRHQHIRLGLIPEKAFLFFMRQKEFWGKPMILETPKEEDMDERNLERLRLIRKTAIADEFA